MSRLLHRCELFLSAPSPIYQFCLALYVPTYHWLEGCPVHLKDVFKVGTSYKLNIYVFVNVKVFAFKLFLFFQEKELNQNWGTICVWFQLFNVPNQKLHTFANSICLFLTRRFWALGFLTYTLSCAKLKKNPPWKISKVSLHVPATSAATSVQLAAGLMFNKHYFQIQFFVCSFCFPF